MGNKFLTVISLSHITRVLHEGNSGWRDRHVRIRWTDLPVIESPLIPPQRWLISRAMLSVCSLHWRDKTERDLVSITVLADVYSESDVRDFPAVYSFLLRVGPGDGGLGLGLEANTADNIISQSIPILPALPTPTTVPISNELPNRELVPGVHGLPLLRLIFCGHTEIANMASSIQDFSTYSILSPPSHCAKAVFAFHGDGVGVGPGLVYSHDHLHPGSARTLATFAQGQVLFCSIDHLTLAHPPATRSLYMEFYSGAVYYASADSHAVVILHFD